MPNYYGTSGNDNVTASQGADFVYGGAGNDWVLEGDGQHPDSAADHVYGGDGDDIAWIGYLDSAYGGAGNDQLILNLENAPAAFVADMSAMWTGASVSIDGAVIEGFEVLTWLNATPFNDTIVSGSLAGTTSEVEGNGGADTLTGGAGNDTLLAGSNLPESDVDVLTGAGGDDWLVGGIGDAFYGGSGVDKISFDVSLNPSGVSLNFATLISTGADTLLGATFQGIEHVASVVGTPFNDTLDASADPGASNLFGLAGSDILTSGGGDDRLDGGAGADFLYGGDGSDTYVVDDPGDVIVEGVSVGQDIVEALVNFTLPGNVEVLNLRQGSAAVQGTGNGLANVINGNSAANLLSGGAGNDTLIGLDGNDMLSGDAGSDALNGGQGWDVASYDIASTAATWTHQSSGLWTVATGGSDVDTLSGVEVLRFTDRDVVLWAQGVVTGDFNHDGKSDVLWRNDSGELYVWNSQSGLGAFVGQSLGLTGTSWSVQEAADFNADGRADVLWRNTSGEVYISLNVSDGATEHLVGQSLGVVDNALVIQTADGDFNGDGRADVLFRNSGTGEVYLWNSQGTSDTLSFQGQSLGVTGAGWSIIGIGDFNGDGRSDLLWRNTSGEAYVQKSASSGAVALTGQTLGMVDNGWTAVGVGDFNGDSRADILWRFTDGSVYLWNSQASGSTVGFLGQSLGLVGLDWQIAGIGDFNADGRSDIMWRNANGDVYVWNSEPSGAVAFNGQGLGNTTMDWHILSDFHGM